MAKELTPEPAPNVAQRIVITPAKLAEVDEAMWLRAREGDVAAAKVVYARLAENQPVPESLPAAAPCWADVEEMFKNLQSQQKALQHEPGVLDDVTKLDIGTTG